MQIIEEYRAYYNYERPHWGIGLRTPIEAYTGLSYLGTKELKLKERKIA